MGKDGFFNILILKNFQTFCFDKFSQKTELGDSQSFAIKISKNWENELKQG